MNKSELVESITEKLGDRRTAGAAVEAVLDTVMRSLAAGEKVALSGFGVFEKVDRAARTARNPATGEPVSLAATSVPRFRAGQVFKAVVSGARELPAQAATTAPPRTRSAAPRAARASTSPAAPDVAVTPDQARGAARNGKAAKPSAQDKPVNAKKNEKKAVKKKDAKKGSKK